MTGTDPRSTVEIVDELIDETRSPLEDHRTELEELAAIRKRLEDRETDLARRDELVRELAGAGVTKVSLERVTGLSRMQVHRLTKGERS